MSLVSPVTGLRHSTDDPAALAAVDTLQDALLVYGLDAARLEAPLTADPGFAAGTALAAALHLLALSASGHAAAGPLLAAAQAGAARATPREQLLIAAVAAWYRGNLPRVVALHLELARRHPRDLVSARIGQFHLINRSDWRRLLGLTAALLPANGDVPQVRGMHAFALEQAGATRAAEALGRCAADAAFDPWAEHAVAHALDRQGRARDGIAFLSPRSTRWQRCSSFLRGHNWWHLALFHLGAGEGDVALALYDREIWGLRPDHAQDQVNAVLLLARAEAAGLDVAGRWAALGPHLAEGATHDAGAFVDLVRALGLGRSDPAAGAKLVARLRQSATTARSRLSREALAPAAAGLLAHGRGDWSATVQLLGPALPGLGRAGGSATQRQFLPDILADALCRQQAATAPAAQRPVQWPVRRPVAGTAPRAAPHQGMPPLEPAPPLSRFEFWPTPVFYFPLMAWAGLLALRHGGLRLPLLANPGLPAGGLVGESKAVVLGAVAPPARRWFAPHVAVSRGSGPAEAALEAALAALGAAGLAFPLVAKPDLGCRGAGVRPVNDAAELLAYLRAFPRGAGLILQQLVAWEAEAGIAWVKLPGASAGRIASITLKYFPHVVGDGVSTIEQLIRADPRAGRLAHLYLGRNRANLARVLPRGEAFRIAFAGSHSRGAIFRDGQAHATEALQQRLEEICAGLPEFWFGRFDVRFRDIAALERGEDFLILEVNGAGAEFTHIWDSRMTLAGAYRSLFAQWQLAFRIGAINRRRGFRPESFGRLRARWRAERALVRACPETA